MKSSPDYRQISTRAFRFALMDLAALRNRFAKTQDISHLAISKLPRSKLINGMLAHEFGAETVIDYVSQCLAWDEDKEYVEHA